MAQYTQAAYCPKCRCSLNARNLASHLLKRCPGRAKNYPIPKQGIRIPKQEIRIPKQKIRVSDTGWPKYLNIQSSDYGWNPEKSICPVCGGDGGANRQCYKCEGSGLALIFTVPASQKSLASAEAQAIIPDETEIQAANIETPKVEKDVPVLPRENPSSLTVSKEITTLYTEGDAHEIHLTVYERDPKARAACIAHYGPKCFICKFDFEKTYGNLGRGYIHVHHLELISSIKENHAVNPIEDLRPLCPNCHAMVHRNRKTPLSIEELKAITRN